MSLQDLPIDAQGSEKKIPHQNTVHNIVTFLEPIGKGNMIDSVCSSTFR